MPRSWPPRRSPGERATGSVLFFFFDGPRRGPSPSLPNLVPRRSCIAVPVPPDWSWAVVRACTSASRAADRSASVWLVRVAEASNEPRLRVGRGVGRQLREQRPTSPRCTARERPKYGTPTRSPACEQRDNRRAGAGTAELRKQRCCARRGPGSWESAGSGDRGPGLPASSPRRRGSWPPTTSQTGT